jgi:hypothetical protein
VCSFLGIARFYLAEYHGRHTDSLRVRFDFDGAVAIYPASRRMIIPIPVVPQRMISAAQNLPLKDFAQCFPEKIFGTGRQVCTEFKPSVQHVLRRLRMTARIHPELRRVEE